MFSLFKRAQLISSPAAVLPTRHVASSQQPALRPAAPSAHGMSAVTARTVVPTLPVTPYASVRGGIAFDANLVNKLKGDHQEMLGIYGRLLGAAEARAPVTLHDDLILFRRVFQGHILMESVRFYVYLDRLLADHPSVRDEARAVRKDMNAIAKAVADFIMVWISSPISPDDLPRFIVDLKAIGAALVARVELEESSLYTLYTETL